MLNEKVVKLLNEQINKELFSAYLYLEMADYYADKGLNGYENWFYIQTKEEQDHAMLIRKYLQNNGEKIELGAIDAPGEKYNNIKEPLVKALEHEKFVTESIHNIYEVASECKDFRTMQFLNWFIEEQGEEEKNTEDLILRFDLFGSDSKGLYMLDNEYAGRVYTAPTLVLD